MIDRRLKCKQGVDSLEVHGLGQGFLRGDLVLDAEHGVLELLEVNDPVVVLVVFVNEGIHQLLVAVEVFGVDLEDELELLPLYLAVPVEVEGVEGELQVVLVRHDGLVNAHGYELVVVYLPVAVSVDGGDEVLQVAEGDVVPLPGVEELVEFLDSYVAVLVVVDGLEEVPHRLDLRLRQLCRDVGGHHLLQLHPRSRTFANRENSISRLNSSSRNMSSKFLAPDIQGCSRIYFSEILSSSGLKILCRRSLS